MAGLRNDGVLCCVIILVRSQSMQDSMFLFLTVMARDACAGHAHDSAYSSFYSRSVSGWGASPKLDACPPVGRGRQRVYLTLTGSLRPPVEMALWAMSMKDSRLASGGCLRECGASPLPGIAKMPPSLGAATMSLGGFWLR